MLICSSYAIRRDDVGVTLKAYDPNWVLGFNLGGFIRCYFAHTDISRYDNFECYIT